MTKQKQLNNNNLKDRVYFTTKYDWKTQSTGKAIIFPKPYTERPFSKQTPTRIMTREQYNKEYNNQQNETTQKEEQTKENKWTNRSNQCKPINRNKTW